MPMKNPPHPGFSVRHDCLEALGLSVTEAARKLGVSRKQLSAVVNGHSGISPEMAIRLDKAFGGDANTWYRLQAAYDLAQAMKKADQINVERVSTVASPACLSRGSENHAGFVPSGTIKEGNCPPSPVDHKWRLEVPSESLELGARKKTGATVITDYLKHFPISGEQLPPRLRGLLESVPADPQIQVEVATSYDFDQHGPNREYVHMVMALTSMPKPSFPHILNEARNGVVSFSTPDVQKQGGLTVFNPSVSGLEYIVASWGNGSFYSYNLSEKVWMAMGLSPRCLGGDLQTVVYDDLSLPEFGVAKGEITTQYFYSPKRNVRWIMSNEYLRRYLWMRGTYGMRVFFYEALLSDTPELRALMAGESHVVLGANSGWYKLDIREMREKLFVQVWAAVVAIPPKLCSEQSADGLMWPGVADPMNRNRANGLTELMPVYLDDRFLERYEQSSLFETVPVNLGRQWACSPSYLRQWSFTDCQRIGRNIVKVPMRELYKPKPDREILHAYAHVLDPAKVAEFAQDEEHIVSKTHRFVVQLTELGAQLEALGAAIGEPKRANEIVGFSRAELAANGWLNYPELCKLAQVAPLAMTEQAFLSRCKSIHELWQRIPNGFLRKLIVRAGHSKSDIKELGSLKLLQALSNIVERLNAHGEYQDAFGTGGTPSDLTDHNTAFVALFANYDLRKADAHNAGDVLRSLEKLGFDVAALSQGYGRALDQVFDSVIEVFSHLNKELAKLLRR